MYVNRVGIFFHEYICRSLPSSPQEKMKNKKKTHFPEPHSHKYTKLIPSIMAEPSPTDPNPHSHIDGDELSDIDNTTPNWRNGVNRSNKRWGIWQTIDRKLFHKYHAGVLDMVLPDEWILSPEPQSLPTAP